MEKVAVVVPIYKKELDALEQYSLDYSLATLVGREIFFVGSVELDRHYYFKRYGSIPFVAFNDACFQTITGYNRLLLSTAFYKQFTHYDFILVLQTDAITLRDELDFWCGQPFDYVGAPWPDGYELFVNAGKFEGGNGRRVRAMVGNGGLSLRRVYKCLSLLEEFADIVSLFDRTGSSEDLFFSVMGTLSGDFIIPNEMIASRFSLELKPSYYHAVNGGRLPMGSHAWWKYEPEFWRPYLKYTPPLLETVFPKEH
jgi:hypothetical protein